MSTLGRAIAIAADAHAGQLDRAGAPYVLHPLRVMDASESEVERMVAVLHDVVEDSAWTLDGLRAEGFSEEVVSAIDAVSRREGEPYMEFVERAAAHPLGARIKRADLLDNLDPSRISNPTAEDYERLHRYLRALALLDGVADEAP